MSPADDVEVVPARWVMATIMLVVTSLMVMDRINISVAARDIMHDFHLSKVRMGFVFAAYTGVYAFANLLGGKLVDRYGPRRVLAISIFVWSVFTALTAWAPTTLGVHLTGSAFAILITVRCLIGLGEGGGTPSYAKMVARWFPARERGVATGFVWAGNALGGGIGPMLVALIMVAWSWRTAFYALGLAGIFLSIIWFVIGRDGPSQHPWPDETQKLGSESTQPGSISRTIRTPGMIALMLIAICSGYCNYFFFSWLFTYFAEERHFSLLQSGFFTSLPFLVSALAAPMTGWVSDEIAQRFGSRIGRCALAATACLIGSVAIFAGVAVNDPLIAALLLSAGAAMCFVFTLIIFTTVIGLVLFADVGMASGILLFCGHIGGAISPPLAALIVEKFGWPAAFVVTTLLLMITAALWLRVIPFSSDNGARIR